MKFYSVIIWMIFGASSAFGLVDMKNGNYSKSFVDFKIESSLFPLTLERTYSSRSIYRGLLGMGWCSNLETRVEVLPDGLPKIVICGGGLEVFYSNRKQKPNIGYQVNEIIRVVKKQNKTLTASYFAKLKKKLMRDQTLRAEFLRAYNIKGKLQPKGVYFANGIKDDVLQYNQQGFFKRTQPGGVQQFFRVSDGRMIQISDRLGNYFKINWRNGKPAYLIDNKGRKVSFNYKNNRITVKDGSRQLALYQMKDGNLQSANLKSGVYQYSYDDLHNLKSSVFYSSKKDTKPIKESLTYNTQKDWVTSFTNARKCIETYDYKTDPRNSNHYWTTLVKKCGDIVTNKSRYEYWNKKNKQGRVYLSRARQDVNGSITDIIYDSQFQKATRVNQNGLITTYDFYKKGKYKGLLRKKGNPLVSIHYKSYHSKCRKPNKVLMSTNSKSRSVSQNNTQELKITFNQASCYTQKIERSDGRWVQLNHDDQGRIEDIKDQSGKQIQITWHPHFNVPQQISQVGVGLVSLNIDSKTGETKGFKNNSDPVTIGNVMSVFNGFLEIINPVASQIRI